jgi:predicted metal-dependent HD superfamily phosphohydrolase
VTDDTTSQWLRRQAETLLVALGAEPEPAASFYVSRLQAHYTAPERYYHNLDHIQACLGVLKVFGPDPAKYMTPKEYRAIELAIWFHDVVYDPKSHTNEADSVTLLSDCAKELNLKSPAIIENACTAIMATRHKGVPEGIISEWVVDADLSILGTPSADVFDEYERQVREEYAFVDDSLWIPGRTQVLHDFLSRKWIYSTPEFRTLYDAHARNNLKRSIARLAKGQVLRMVR